EKCRQWWSRFNGQFQNVDISPVKLVSLIHKGHAYTTQHKRYRKADNFLCGQHLALDLDTEDERSSFDYLLQREFIAHNASFLYTTASHTEQNPKCRVVFVLDRPIYD